MGACFGGFSFHFLFCFSYFFCLAFDLFGFAPKPPPVPFFSRHFFIYLSCFILIWWLSLHKSFASSVLFRVLFEDGSVLFLGILGFVLLLGFLDGWIGRHWLGYDWMDYD